MFDSALRFLTQKQMLLSKNHEFNFIIARRPFESLHGFSKFELLNSKVSFLITSFALLTCSVVAEKKKRKKCIGYIKIIQKFTRKSSTQTLSKFIYLLFYLPHIQEKKPIYNKEKNTN